MSDDKDLSENRLNDLNENRLNAYQRICGNYRAIEDFRGKLLGFLPLATFAGIFVVLPESQSDQGLLNELIVPFGIFGFFVALGLFIFELFGISKCTSVISCGKALEVDLKLKNRGYFTTRADPIFKLVAEPLASGVIYGAVLPHGLT